jgi:hypothetical protein
MSDTPPRPRRTTPYYILNGHDVVEATLTEWIAWLGAVGDARAMIKTPIGKDCEVSTVFLGIDHNWGGGRIHVFETMVFGGPMAEEYRRYSTWDEAMAGHARMVELVKSKMSGAESDPGSRFGALDISTRGDEPE